MATLTVTDTRGLRALIPDRAGRWENWLLLILVAALWVGTHPYAGIVGDARFYNVQFLRALSPFSYEGDLYFVFGSQDDYSIFTIAFAPVIRLLGLNAGNIVLDLSFQALWLTGLWSLVTALLEERRARIVAVAAVVVLPGGVNFVHYGEPLVTPRLLAEALTLWALAAMLRRRQFAALAVLLLAASVHPLMTIPGFAVLFLKAAGRIRLWWALLPVAACAAGLALTGVPPFSALARTFDPAWFTAVGVRDGFCFIGNWGLADWLPVCTTFTLSLVGLCFGTAAERSLLSMALATATSGLVASFVGADLLHLTLVTDAQLWRATWLLAVVANLCFATSLVRLWPTDGISLAAAVLAVSAILLAVSRFFAATELVAAPLVFLGWLAALWSAGGRRTAGPAIRGLLVVAILLAVVLAIFAVEASARVLALTPRGVWPAVEQAVQVGVCLVAVAMLILRPAPVARFRPRWLASYVGAVCLFAVLLAAWDQRSAWRIFIETSAPPLSLLAEVPPGSNVYWEGDVTVPWLLLRQASYFSCEQGSGILFKRSTAIAYQERFDSFSRLGSVDFWHDSYCPGVRNRFAAPIAHADLSTLCQREPALDKIVLTEAARDDIGEIWVPAAVFVYTVEVEGQRQRREQRDFHVYDCATLRRG